jgi:hypothetical protein
MTTPTDNRTTTPWEDAGALVVAALAGANAVLVTGRDPDAAARAAIGIGRIEATRRRVAIGDLVGDVAPLVALMDADDVHGVVDSFLYGVSLNRVAHPVSGVDNLFVLPSGTEPIVTEEIFRSDRWRRLATGFREVGALLLLVAPLDAPGLETLAEMMDGVVRVGDDPGAVRADVRVLATVTPLGTRAVVEEPPVVEPVSAARRARHRGRPPAVLHASSAPAPARSRALVPLLVLLALAAGGAGAMWMLDRKAAAERPAPAPRDTAVAAAAPDTAPATDTLAMQLVPANPADSASAAGWAIEVAKVSSEEGARLSVGTAGTLPLITYFPVRLGNDPDARWYRVMGGAWATRADADSALAALGARGKLELPASVVLAPLSLLVGPRLGSDSLRARIGRYERAGVPTYPLLQPDSTYNLYAGAFETPDQSLFLALALQKLGDVPTLVYRIGRAP